MVTIRQITKRKDFKKFVRFPTNLYKDNPNYIPPMEMDEMKMTSKSKLEKIRADSSFRYFPVIG